MKKIHLYIVSLLVVWGCTKTLVVAPKIEDNPAMVELGHHLFFDTRLSKNDMKSCAACHQPKFAFTDGYRKSMGMFADETKRNSPTLLNTAFLKHLTWADHIATYEDQMLKPMFADAPPELGLKKTDTYILSRFVNDSLYGFLFQKAFQKPIQHIDYEDIIKSIAAYERKLISFNTAYDGFKKGEQQLSAQAKKGIDLFFSDATQCSTCHRAPLFTDDDFHKSYSTDADNGLADKTQKRRDKKLFRTPTLRNIALTSPYMHDGSIDNLDDAIQHKFKVNGHKNRPLSKENQQYIIHFLNTLTDSTLFNNSFFNDPKF
jgi:cytochrome c peroxidase